MTLQDISGRTYGPTHYRLDPEKVLDFLDATGEDHDRWVSEAPPGYAGVLLFAIAPDLLADPDLASHNHGVIHGDQSFTWHRPLTLGAALSVTGTVTKLRERAGVAFLGFSIAVDDQEGSVLEGVSTFILSGDKGAAGEHAEESEDGPHECSRVGPDQRCASRSDLVRYAGASRDFNPIHWDHDSAVTAGLPGVVVHGLLQSAWMLQPLGQVRTARFRYRAPLRPGRIVSIEVEETGGGTIGVSLSDGETEYVSAKVERDR